MGVDDGGMEEKIIKVQNLKKLQSEMLDWVNRECAPRDSEGDEESEEEANSRAEGQQECKLRGKMWMVLQAKLKSRF